MFRTLNTFFYFVVGNHRKHSVRERLLNFASLFNGIANLFGGINFLWLLNSSFSAWLHISTALIYLSVYYFSRRFRLYGYLFWFFIFTNYIFIAWNIIDNYGTQGGAHYYLFPIFLLSLMLGRGKGDYFGAFLLHFGILCLLAYAEQFMLLNTNVIPPLENRISDLYSNIPFAMFFNALIFLVLVKSFNDEQEKTETLLNRLYPKIITEELKRTNNVKPKNYSSVSILFIDFVNFTGISEKLNATTVLEQLEYCFGKFDEIAEKHNIEKIKTIGDSYMAAAGLPQQNITHPIDIILFALKAKMFFYEYCSAMKDSGKKIWHMRTGINTGSVVAGVIGMNKPVYDIWGDAVNTASRLETSSEVDQINISESTYQIAKLFFECEFRGALSVKNKSPIKMYFLNRLKPKYSADPEGFCPNITFAQEYERFKRKAQIE